MSDPNTHSDVIESAVVACLSEYPGAAQPLCVAFSGGMDSSVLLHALRQVGAGTLRAVHVDHQLHADSADWAGQCRKFCAQLDVSLTVVQVEIDGSAGTGLEAAAREARYRAIAACLQPDELLLTAHHRTDQLETYLLQLFRGAGLHGLAAMARESSLGGLNIRRPLLNVSAAAIRAYAESASLAWVDDPSNSDTRFDRNFLRHVIVPRVLERWPAAERAVARSARLSGEAIEILDATARADIEGGLQGNRLQLEVIRKLSAARQRNALRLVLRMLGLPIPSEKQLSAALALMLRARWDSNPEARWPGVCLYRFRDCLWCYSENQDPANWPVPDDGYRWDSQGDLDMGPVRGKLKLADQTGAGIAVEYIDAQLDIRFRQGGERLRPNGKGRTRNLKKLLQESEIPPWMRCHIPLIYSGERLLAAGDLWVNADYAAGPGQAGRSIVWRNHAAIR